MRLEGKSLSLSLSLLSRLLKFLLKTIKGLMFGAALSLSSLGAGL